MGKNEGGYRVVLYDVPGAISLVNEKVSSDWERMNEDIGLYCMMCQELYL